MWSPLHGAEPSASVWARTEAYKQTMISRVPFPNCRSGVIGLAIAGNPENDVHLSPWQLPAPKVGSCVDRQRTHMRTYQKHVGLSMLSFLSCVSLPIPCQALGREKLSLLLCAESLARC